MPTINDFTTLGNSGLSISKIIVGCMTFGSSKWADWVIEDEDKVMSILWECYENGLTTFDTADLYSNGQSEILLGKFIKKYNIPRDKIVILTKCFMAVEPNDLSFRLGSNPGENPKPDYLYLNSKGLSRKHIFEAVQASIDRLGTYIDVLQIHRLDNTPKVEIMKALNDVVEKGWANYIGASTMKAYEFIELQSIAEKNNWVKFISMQNYYNLLYREEEREIIPFCSKNTTFGKITCIPWSPMARGILARPFNSDSTIRQKTDPTFKKVGLDEFSSVDKEIINRVEKIALKKGVSMANVATAWVLSKGHCPILGVNSVERVHDAINALKLVLTEEEIKYLEEPYQPKPSLT